MEKAVFPLSYMNITQGVDGSYSHMGTNAIDLGNRGYKEKIYAPFDGVIRKIYTKSGNFVWLESKEKVLWADGSVDYMTVMTGHDDDVSDLFVGKEVKAGEEYYAQGTAGNATGIHVHLEAGRGKFTGDGWYKNSYGKWMIQNSVKPYDAFFVKPDTVIDNDAGYPFRTIIEKPVARDTTKNQIEVKVTNLRCRKTPNGPVLGFVDAGFYTILDSTVNGAYTWYKIGESNWIAYDSAWATLYSVAKEDDSSKENADVNVGQKEENTPSDSAMSSTPLTKLFTCERDDIYYLQLYKGEILYIANKKNT